MSSSRILTITSDKEFLTLFRQQLRDQVGNGGRLIVAASIDEACSLLETVRPRLIVVHWARDSARYEQLDRLLWSTSVLTRRTPVLVIAERYRTDQATMMYRMGVSDYISRTHHFHQVGRVFSSYLPAMRLASADTVDASDMTVSADTSRVTSRVRRPITAQVG
jgi:DNA-binding response OmpR family regulator